MRVTLKDFKTMTKEITKLPSLQEIYSDKGAVIKQNQLNIILNAEPKKEWIKTHPMTKQNYIPIERQEYLLTMIFGKWRLEVKEVKLIANSVQVTVRVHVLDPISGEWDWQDGVGAVPIQIKKGSGGAIDFSNMNSNAIQIGAPAAESYAFKDAVEKFGKIFGKDINRKDGVQYIDRIHAMIDSMQESNMSKVLVEQIRAATTEDQLKQIWEQNQGLGKEFAKLITEQKEFIKSVNESENANP